MRGRFPKKSDSDSDVFYCEVKKDYSTGNTHTVRQQQREKSGHIVGIQRGHLKEIKKSVVIRCM